VVIVVVADEHEVHGREGLQRVRHGEVAPRARELHWRGAEEGGGRAHGFMVSGQVEQVGAGERKKQL
jgi:hypothetical protein